MCIHLPVYQDACSRPSKIDRASALFAGAGNLAKETTGIYLDAMGFGMGCCCLQITFQARDMEEGRRLYDQLAVVCPIVVIKGL